jgi:phosphate transporter
LCCAQGFHINPTQMYVVAVSFLTVGLWCCNGYLTPYFGEMGVIAIIPLVAFFGTGVLDKVRGSNREPCNK